MTEEKKPFGLSFFEKKPTAEQGSAQEESSFSKNQNAESIRISVPEITLPKGGGALKSIDEKFQVNPSNGTASMAIPIPVAPSRQGFSPALSLSYNSGSGNGPFGLGWSVDIPSIIRKTEKRLPQYNDQADSDIFQITGAEDLVPVVEKDANGNWNPLRYTHTYANGKKFDVQQYRARVEGMFARIEKWTSLENGDAFWKVTSRENVTSIYGPDTGSRITDPARPHRIFQWMLERSYDDKGNIIHYQYRKEDTAGIPNLLSEDHRLNGQTGFTNIYPETILYGARTPYDPVSGTLPAFLFKTVFDYTKPQTTPSSPELVNNAQWTFRKDAFSDYHACFEIRTSRLCHRVLLFHLFDELGPDPCLVKSLDLSYTYDEEAALNLLTRITSSAYKKINGQYVPRSFPPMDLTYQNAAWDMEVKKISPDNLVHAPAGIQEGQYSWVDLYSEGVSGMLTEQGNAWWYKENLGGGSFTHATQVIPKPSFQGLNSEVQLQDLEADGRKFLVSNVNGLSGYFEMTEEKDWLPFQPFLQQPSRNLAEPGIRFIDLDGDGKPDLFISEEEVFCWHPARGKEGFDPHRFAQKHADENKGPSWSFADASELIMFIDVNGDGLTDIVRIRNGGITYWPNTGYGTFGARVVMDNAPVVDATDAWNPAYIRLTDINGTGTPDLVYLGKNSFRIWFNQNGNSWSHMKEIPAFPEITHTAHITTVDLLANGTSCIVWSSPLPADSGRHLQYIDLMKGKKPFVLTGYANNLGKKISFSYQPSTHYYLQDKRKGKPWISRLPFPVQCVDQIIVEDAWRKTRFSSQYSYHHGYFDYPEREFRGFGRVEQLDTESFGKFLSGNTASPYITGDKTLYQPPIKTISWFHTGAGIRRDKILQQLKKEWFPHSLASNLTIDHVFAELDLPNTEWKDDIPDPITLRESFRACKGMMLRQEIYELDADLLETGQQVAVRLFTASSHHAHIQLLQPRQEDHHAVFLVTESEAVNYQYDLILPTGMAVQELKPDPRITHTLNLSLDSMGNVQQQVAVGYPRVRPHEDQNLAAAQLADIHSVQNKLLVSYTETHYTDDYIDTYDPNNLNKILHHRRRVPYEVQTFELYGLQPTGPYFQLSDLRRFALSSVYPETPPPSGVPAANYAIGSLSYHELPPDSKKYKRLVNSMRTLFFSNALSGPLGLGEMGFHGLPYEQYQLALTDSLLQSLYSNNHLSSVITGGQTVIQALRDAQVSGYLSGADAVAKFGAAAAGEYWIRSGIAGFQANAPARFYLPEKYTDAFGATTTLQFDAKYAMFMLSTTNALNQTTSVYGFDYRVLAPGGVKDPNLNCTEIYFDIRGMVVATAVKGKGTQADDLGGFTDAIANPLLPNLTSFFTSSNVQENDLHDLLKNATTRYLYSFGEELDANGNVLWGKRPAGACTILREQHVATLPAGSKSLLQVAFECSDGSGTVLFRKNRAEAATPNGPLRWITNGKVVLNNKGNAVKQYEPYFSVLPAFESEPVEQGVTSVFFYDAASRLVRTEMPDGTYSRVSFTPWEVTTYDANDTMRETGNAWYAAHTATTASAERQRAAEISFEHHQTPAVGFFDSLGRAVISMVHNKVKTGTNQWTNEKYLTISRLDAEGKPLWIRDARGNLVMQYVKRAAPLSPLSINTVEPSTYIPAYSLAGVLLFQHSMDGGDRWLLHDATGQPLAVWDNRNNLLTYHYDALRRPTQLWLFNATHGSGAMVGLLEYDGAGMADPQIKNAIGKTTSIFDQSGVVRHDEFDWQGNATVIRRQLALAYATDTNWQPVLQSAPSAWEPILLMPEVFFSRTRFDALGRMVRHYNWHRSNEPVSVYEPAYNERGLLHHEDLTTGAIKTTSGHNGGSNIRPIRSILYNEKGQRISILYGNYVKCTYTYDPATFRLANLVTRRQNNSLLQDLAYTYDPVGNITEIADNAIPTVFFNGFEVQPRNRYQYDPLYRLIEAEGREHAGQVSYPSDDNWHDSHYSKVHAPNDAMAWQRFIQRYSYDRTGNILIMEHRVPGNTAAEWTRQYQYAKDSNRLLATGMGNIPPTERYADTATLSFPVSYNEHGSMAMLSHLSKIDWDFTEHLQHIVRTTASQGTGPDDSPDNSIEAWYRYDGSKQRTRKRVEKLGNIVEERLYLGGLEWYRRWQQGVLLEEIETVHVFDGSSRVLMADRVIATQRAGVSTGTLYRYILSNHLGSGTMELDENAAVISSEEYHPFGTTAYQAGRSAAEVSWKRYRYTGMERDDESGLGYHAARYYLLWLGRWLSCDPTGIRDGWNLYEYVGANPMSATDGSGQSRVETDYTKPAVIEHLKKYNLPYATEVAFDVLDSSGNVITSGRVDVATIDPKKGTFIFPELKGLDINSQTANQKTYIPILESSEGAMIRITNQKGGTLGLSKGMVLHVNKESYYRVGSRELKDFAAKLQSMTGGVAFKHSYLEKSGKMHLFETTEEFMKFLDVPERRSLLESIREAGMATKKVGSTTAKASGVVSKSVKEGEQLTKKVVTGAEKVAGVDTGNRMSEYGELQQMQPENAKIAGDTSNKVTEAYKMSAGALLGETGVPDGGPGNVNYSIPGSGRNLRQFEWTPEIEEERERKKQESLEKYRALRRLKPFIPTP